ncbi:MAG: response regulator [Proteobacteria bacterium]|nr:response regulator [Pseudomonadota bacterium]
MSKNNAKAKVLYVDDDLENLSSFKAVFRRDYDIFLADNAEKGLEILRENNIQVLISDQRMPETTGTELLEQVAKEFPKTQRFLLTAFSDFDPLVEAINKGKLQGYFSKPIDADFIRRRIKEGLEKHYLEIQNQDLLEKVQERETFLNAIVENIPDFVFVKDAKTFQYLRLNQSAEAFLGYSPKEMLGKTAHDVFPHETAEIFHQNDLEVIKRGRVVEIPEEAVRSKAKGLCYLDTKIIPIKDDKGQLVYILGVSRDITEHRNLQEKEKSLQSQLRHFQKMEAIGTLAGGIAHDFNNILASIMGYTELSFAKVEKETVLKDYLAKVLTAGARAKELVGQILTFARQSDEEIKPVRIDMILKEVLALIRSAIPTTIDIRQNIESHSMVLGNHIKFHQIFMNLFTNASQAMEEEGGVLEVGLINVELDHSDLLNDQGLSPGNYLKVTISDTGAGISPHIMDSIFQPYFTTKEPGEGTGMGLAMVHGIVENSGGKIFVKSDLGKGTVFTIYLPVTAKTIEYAAEENEELPRGDERILFVDDEQSIAMMSQLTLEQLGYRVTSLSNSIDALTLFRSRPYEFDLVITDMTMPKITGDIFSAELIKIRPELPIILCSGYSRKISKARASAIGIKAFLYKPVQKAQLARTIRAVLDHSESDLSD